MHTRNLLPVLFCALLMVNCVATPQPIVGCPARSTFVSYDIHDISWRAGIGICQTLQIPEGLALWSGPIGGVVTSQTKIIFLGRDPVDLKDLSKLQDVECALVGELIHHGDIGNEWYEWIELRILITSYLKSK